MRLLCSPARRWRPTQKSLGKVWSKWINARMENAIYLHVQGRVGWFALSWMFNAMLVRQKPHEIYRDSTFAANIVRGAFCATGASPAAAPAH